MVQGLRNGGERREHEEGQQRHGAERPGEDPHGEEFRRGLPRRQHDADEGSDDRRAPLSPEEEIGAEHSEPRGSGRFRRRLRRRAQQAAASVDQVLESN